MSEKAFKPEPSKDSSDRIKRTDPDKESRGLPFLFNREQTEALSKTMSVGFDEGPTVKPSGNVQAKAGPGQQPVARQMPDLSKLKPTVPPKSPAQLKKEEQFRETWGMQHMSPEKQMQLKLKYDKEGLEADMARGHFNNYVKQQAKQLKRNKHEKNLLNNKANAFKRAMIQNKIAYGSPEYNTAVKQCFPDFDTELPAYKKDVGKNPVNDDPKLEHEADVMGKQAAEGKTVQKQEEEKERQAKKGGSNPPSPSGSGTKTKLPEEVQSKMENSFGTSFSDVNIHPNDEGAKDMGALAYTQGKDVHFAPGQYSPGTQKGQELIGHELTHVEQQKAGRVQPTAQGKGMAVNDDPKLENEADEMGKKAAEGKAAAPQVAGTTQSIRRKEINEKDKEPREKEKAVGSGAKIILHNPEDSYVTAYSIINNKFKKAFELDNGSVVELQPEAKRYKDLTAIKGLKRKSKTFYVVSQYAGVSLEEVKAVSNQINKYGMVWREKMETEESILFLEKKGYKKLEVEKILEDEDSIETFFALLRDEPDNAQNTDKKVLDYNTRVFVISSPFPGWSYVETNEGETGYIKSAAINTRMPSTNSKLYQVRKGDSLEKIINESYGEAHDRRFYANALMQINNPENKQGRGITYEGALELKELFKITSYEKFHVKEKQWIWVPDENYVLSLAGQIPDYSIEKKIKETAYSLNGFVSNIVDRLWPVGFSLITDSNIGVTFGIPVGVVVNAQTSLFRKDEDNFVVRRFLKGGVGADTGVGAGIYWGSSKGIGAGAEAGANASAMGTAYTDLEFTFPFKKDATILMLLTSVMEPPRVDDAGTIVKNTPRKSFFQFLHQATGLNLDTSNYLTKSKVALGIEAQATADANMGIKADKQARKQVKSKYKGHKKDSDPSATNALMRWLHINAGVGISNEFFLGAETENVKRDEKNNELISADGALFLDGRAQAHAKLPILPALAVDVGGAIKLTFKYAKGKWKQYGAAVAFKGGDLDNYEGAAMEISASQSNKEIEQLFDKKIDITEKLANLLGTIKFKKRFQLLADKGFGRYNSTKQKQQATKTLLKENYKNTGVYFSSYLTLELDIGKLLKNKGAFILKRIVSDIWRKFIKKTRNKDMLEVQKMFLEHIFDVLSNGKPIVESELFEELWSFIISREAINKAELAMVGEFGFAAGASIAALEGKARLHASAKIAGVYVEDAIDMIENFINQEGGQTFINEYLNPAMGLDTNSDIESENNEHR